MGAEGEEGVGGESDVCLAWDRALFGLLAAQQAVRFCKFDIASPSFTWPGELETARPSEPRSLSGAERVLSAHPILRLLL